MYIYLEIMNSNEDQVNGSTNYQTVNNIRNEI